MSEFDRKVDERIDQWVEARTLSPAINRLLHMSEAEVDAAVRGYEAADQFYKDSKGDCSCAPRGFVSTPRHIKEQMRAEHIKAGVHETYCPMYQHRSPDYEPWSYTLRQQRADEDAERVEYGSVSRFRQGD